MLNLHLILLAYSARGIPSNLLLFKAQTLLRDINLWRSCYGRLNRKLEEI